MSLKGKIGPEEKIQAVEDYLEMRKGSTQIREELGIRLSTFQAWLRKYQTEGAAGLYPKKGFTRYPSSLKLEAVHQHYEKPDQPPETRHRHHHHSLHCRAVDRKAGL